MTDTATVTDALALDAQAQDLLFRQARTANALVNIGHPAENAWFDRLPRLPYEDVVTAL